MENLISKLAHGTGNYKIIKWPGTDHNVKIRVASLKDFSECITAADNNFKDRSEMWRYHAREYEEYKNTRMLHRIVTEEDGIPIGAFTQFESILTNEMKDVLEDEWTQLQDECSPNPENMTPDQVDESISEIKKNPKVMSAGVCSIFAARQLIESMASQLVTLQQANSSSSQQ